MVTKNQTLNTKRQPNFFVVVWNRKEDSLPLVLELKWPHNTLADIWYVFSIWFLVTFQSNERNICIYLLRIWGKTGKHQKDGYSNERICSVLDCEVNISYYVQRKYVSKYVHNNKQIYMWISGVWRMIELSFLNKKYDHLNR